MYISEGARRFLSAHIKAILAGTIVVATVAALSVTRCVSIHSTAPEDIPASSADAPEAPPDEADDSDTPVDKAAEAGASEHQRTLIAAYGADERELISLLGRGPWVDQKTGDTLTFEGSTFTVGDAPARAFAISDLAIDKDDDGNPASWTASLLDDADESHIFTMRLEREGEEDVAVLSSKDLFGGTEWTLLAEADDIDVDVPDERTLEFLGVDPDELADAVRTCAARERAQASKATWDRTLVADLGSSTCGLSYTLDDGHNSIISVEVNLETGSITAEAM